MTSKALWRGLYTHTTRSHHVQVLSSSKIDMHYKKDGGTSKSGLPQVWPSSKIVLCSEFTDPQQKSPQSSLLGLTMNTQQLFLLFFFELSSILLQPCFAQFYHNLTNALRRLIISHLCFVHIDEHRQYL